MGLLSLSLSEKCLIKSGWLILTPHSDFALLFNHGYRSDCNLQKGGPCKLPLFSPEGVIYQNGRSKTLIILTNISPTAPPSQAFQHVPKGGKCPVTRLENLDALYLAVFALCSCLGYNHRLHIQKFSFHVGDTFPPQWEGETEQVGQVWRWFMSIFGGPGMEVIDVNCIYITSAGSRHTALPRCKGAGEGCLHVTPGGKRKIFIEDCLCTMKDYILEAVALISLPGCLRREELAQRTTFLHHTPRDPLTLHRALPHRQPLARVVSLALISPVIPCLSPSEG